MQEISSLKRVNKNPYGNFDLAVQISMDGFSFAILNTDFKSLIGIKHIPIKGIGRDDDLAEIISNHLKKEAALKYTYKSIKACYVSQKSTLIPDEFFDPAKLKSYLDFNQTLDDLDEIHYNHISGINAYNVFAIPNVIANELVSFYPQVLFYNQATSLIANSIVINEKQKAYAASETEIVLNLNHNFFDLLYFKDTKFVLYNTYDLRNEADFVYYILAALKQLQINPAHTTIKLSGIVQDKRTFIDALYNFVTNIQVNVDLPGLYRDKSLKKIPGESFIALNGLFLCE